MIHPDVKAQLFAGEREDKEGEEVRSYMVEWVREPDFSGVQARSGKRERLHALQEAYNSIKQPLLNQLGSEEGISIQDLQGSSQAIVSAPLQKWRSLAQDGGTLDLEDTVRVLPNVLYYSKG